MTLLELPPASILVKFIITEIHYESQKLKVYFSDGCISRQGHLAFGNPAEILGYVGHHPCLMVIELDEIEGKAMVQFYYRF